MDNFAFSDHIQEVNDLPMRSGPLEWVGRHQPSYPGDGEPSIIRDARRSIIGRLVVLHLQDAYAC